MLDAGADSSGDALKDHEDLEERFEREGDDDENGDGDESSSTKKTKKNATNPLDLTFKKLRQLQDEFHEKDANGNKQPINLSIDKFVDALSFNRKKGEHGHKYPWEEELETLFMKIDASCCDKVNWEEFTNFMLLHLPVLGQGDGACEFSQVERSDALAAGWGSGHSDMINSVITIGADAGAPRRYVTAGRDGVVKIWNSSLQLHKQIEVGQHKNWLSSCAWMKQSKRLAVASSDFAIFFYDNSFNPTPVSKIEHPQGTPLCLGYHELQKSSKEDGSDGKEILMVGDNNGYVSVYQMDGDWHAWPMNDNPHNQGGAGGYGNKGGNDRSRNLARGGTRAIEKDDEEAGGDSALRGSKGVKSGRDAGSDNKMHYHQVKPPSREKYHHDWVTKVGFVSELQAMVTCGLDGEINLCDIQKNERKREPIRLHRNSVHSWCWCINYKFFASCGLDRQIIIWNPYTLKAMNFLQGHNASIHEVLVNEERHQLISLSVDKVVKVWDIRNYRCIQTFTDKTEYKPEDRLTCMAFDEEGPALVLCSSTLNLLPVNVKVESSRTHRAAIVCALYNDVFHQVVSGDIAGTICVWDVKSGKREFEFLRVHHDHKLTCMAFDESKRRLYTGSDDGTIKLFNFSSGQALRMYAKGNQSEITGLLTAREGPNPFVVGVAWDRKIYVWNDSKKQTVDTTNVLEDPDGAGQSDISCMCSLAPTQKGMLATGGEDGWVILWKIQEGATNSAGRSIKCRLKDETPHVQIDNSQPCPKDDGRRPKKKPMPQDAHGSDGGLDQAAALPHVSKGGSANKGAPQMSRLSTMAQIDKKKGAPGAVENEVSGSLGEKATEKATAAPSTLPAADGDASGDASKSQKSRLETGAATYYVFRKEAPCQLKVYHFLKDGKKTEPIFDPWTDDRWDAVKASETGADPFYIIHRKEVERFEALTHYYYDVNFGGAQQQFMVMRVTGRSLAVEDLIFLAKQLQPDVPLEKYKQNMRTSSKEAFAQSLSDMGLNISPQRAFGIYEAFQDHNSENFESDGGVDIDTLMDVLHEQNPALAGRQESLVGRAGGGLPEETGFSGDSERFSSPASGDQGVEKMIYLEHKECLLTTHSDSVLRVWSVKKYAFLQRLTLGDTPDKAARSTTSGAGDTVSPPLTTAIHSDQAGNNWLFTGDADGFLRKWDMSEFHPHKPGAPQLKTLVELNCMQPHRQKVTHIQYFELEGMQIVMSAGEDCTVCLNTADTGERIGTFSANGQPWQLSNQLTWCKELPPMEEGSRRKEDDDWYRSPRRPGTKGSGRAKGSSSGGAQGAMDYGRSPRAAAQSRLKTYNTTTQASRTHCGRGVFSELTAVEKHKPDHELAEKAWEERYKRKVQDYPQGGALP